MNECSPIVVSVPGSKSITNRALLLSALAHGKTTLKGILKSDDTRVMIHALKQLGVTLSLKKNTVSITGGSAFRSPRHRIFCGNAGTAMRFLAAYLATRPFESILDGSPRMRQRPIEDLLSALRQLGASAESIHGNENPPVRIRGPLKGGTCTVKGSISSQFLSGLLMASPLAQGTVKIRVAGDLVSKPYVDMTIDLMRRFGVHVLRKGYKEFIIEKGQAYRATEFSIEGDASAASYFWGLAELTGEKIEITNVSAQSSQADMQFLKAVKKMAGAKAAIDCSQFPDAAMTLAVVCAFKKGRWTLTGLHNLRVKECDRLHALATELKKIGCAMRELRDGFFIEGNPQGLQGASIKTYNDHRMAMCFGMAQVVLPQIRIQDPSCVRKTYPNFWRDIKKVKAILKKRNVVLVGMRGCGKTEIGNLLAKKMKRRFIDIDGHIVKTERRSVADIVRESGWKTFRALERKTVQKIAKMPGGAVIATGGGTILDKRNRELLTRNGRVIFLSCNVKELRKRLAQKKDRPSLSARKNFINELPSIYAKRLPSYRAASDAIVDVSMTSTDRKRDLKAKKQLLDAIIRGWGML